jgi:transcriptional regulator with XRE-family HTH domain
MPFKTEKIRQFRLKVGLTQAQLGMVLQVPQSTVARWETGFSVPSAEHIGLMCDFGYVNGIRPDFFFPNYSEIATGTDKRGKPGKNARIDSESRKPRKEKS